MDGFQVIDSRPGQLSLAVEKLKGNHDRAREVQASLAGIRGIHRLEADSHRGRVVLAYDKQQLTSLASLLALKAVFARFFPEVNPTQLASWLSQGI
jgi:hypothetical protein